jgi:hypothetical protein
MIDCDSAQQLAGCCRPPIVARNFTVEVGGNAVYHFRRALAADAGPNPVEVTQRIGDPSERQEIVERLESANCSALLCTVLPSANVSKAICSRR